MAGRLARRLWAYVLLSLVLAACSAAPTPAPHVRTTPPRSRPAPSTPGPYRKPVRIRVAARYRVPIASSGPAVVLGNDLWIALERMPLERISARENPGHLVDIDTRTGKVRGITDIGSLPSGIVASGGHLWVATTPGDIHPPDRDPDLVTEFDRHGAVVHRYRVPDPEAITTAPDGVWVTTYRGDTGTWLRHLHDGHADPLVLLPSTIGRASLADCPDALYTAATNAMGLLVVTRFSRTGKDPHSTRLTEASEAHLTCADQGVLVVAHVSITRISAAGATSKATPPPGIFPQAITADTRIWILMESENGRGSTLVPVDPRTAAVGKPQPIPPAATVAADKATIWAIAPGWVTKIRPG